MKSIRENIEKFEKFIEDTLKGTGYGIIATPELRDSGVDWIVSKNEKTVLVEAKYLQNPISGSIFISLQKGASTLSLATRLHHTSNVDRLLLVTNFNVSQKLKDEYKNKYSIEIWDLEQLSEIVRSDKSLNQRYASYLTDLRNISSETRAMVRASPRFIELKQRLERIPPGLDSFQDYEDVCVDILNYVFSPPFVLPPDIQNMSNDGLHRRDAIYRLETGDNIWDRIQYLFRTKFVLTEFKNLSENLGQNEVEDICRYLYPDAMRSVDLLCGRKGPNNSALELRMGKWRGQKKLVLFLSDEDMKKLLELKTTNNNPGEFIDYLIDSFLMGLNE